MTIDKTGKCTLYAGVVLALMATLVTFAPVRANVVCTVSVALTISDVTAIRIGHNHAAISWSTDGKTTSQVFYDTVSHDTIADYPCYTRQRKALVEKHKVNLNKLSPSTTYYYRVRSTAGGVESVSDEYTFTTLPAPGRWRGWLANLLLECISPLLLWWLW